MKKKKESKNIERAQKDLITIVDTLAVTFFLFICGVLALLPFIDGNWKNWNPATCLPDACFCEKPRGGMLEQPSNTWSNMAFTIYGLITICISARKLIKFKSEGEYTVFYHYSLFYGVAQILLGVMSAWYHCSLTFVGQLLDNIGMILVLGWVFTYEFVRLTPKFRKLGFWVVYLSVNLIYTALNIFVPVFRRYAFFGLIIAVIGAQIIVDLIIKPWKTGGINYWYFGAALGFAATGFGIWLLDLNNIVCYPNSLIQGHFFWHCFMATSSFFLFLFFQSEASKSQKFKK